jgi:iron complex outermembrane receptor protein
MSVNANYTWSRNKFVDFIDDEQVYDGKKLPGIPDHVGQALLKWQPLNRLNLDAQFQYVGSQFIDDANTKINDSYFITNLKAYYRLPKVSWTGSRMKRSQLSTSQMTNSQLSGSRFSGFGLGNIEIFAGINNLFDFLYSPMLTVNAVAFGNAEPRYYYAGLPRHFYGGVRLNLD